MSQRRSIRFDRRIDLEWLDFVAAQVAEGVDEGTIRDSLFEFLDDKVAGGRKHGSAAYKTVVALSQFWLNVGPEALPIRSRAKDLLHGLSPEERIAVHWAMASAAFPFFSALVGNTGRLLALQGKLNLAQLTRRMREEWGDRSTMTRAVQRVVRSMVQWGVLEDTPRKGIYHQAPKRIPANGVVAELLVEALLLHREMPAIAVNEIKREPALFPFEVNVTAHQLRESERFEVQRQGLDVDVVRVVDR